MPRGISERNLIQHELIGLQVSIIDTTCKNQRSLSNVPGQVIDETMNTLKIEYEIAGKQKTVIVPKNQTTFRFTISAKDSHQRPNTVDINGAILTKRPEDRVKKLAKIVQMMNKQGVSKDTPRIK